MNSLYFGPPRDSGRGPRHRRRTCDIPILNKKIPDAHRTFELGQRILVATLAIIVCATPVTTGEAAIAVVVVRRIGGGHVGGCIMLQLLGRRTGLVDGVTVLLLVFEMLLVVLVLLLGGAYAVLNGQPAGLGGGGRRRLGGLGRRGALLLLLLVERLARIEAEAILVVRLRRHDDRGGGWCGNCVGIRQKIRCRNARAHQINQADGVVGFVCVVGRDGMVL